MNRGDCAKLVVGCTLVAADGERIFGANWCANPQEVCPREPGEDYTKCTTICQQLGHAEEVALKEAGNKAKGARAILEGHTYACRDCQEALFSAGVVSLEIKHPKYQPVDFETSPCSVCGKETPNVFNISLKAVPVCERCADSISLQQVNYVLQNK